MATSRSACTARSFRLLCQVGAARGGMAAQHVLDLQAHGRIGLSAVRGLWKIIEISRPRRSASSDSLACSRSMPPNTALPPVTRAARSLMPSIA
jgi:hypothetical protein